MADNDPRDLVIEYTIDGGQTWHHGKTVAGWVGRDPGQLRVQRAAVREDALAEHGEGSVRTRVLPEDDPRCVLSQPPAPDPRPATPDPGGLGLAGPVAGRNGDDRMNRNTSPLHTHTSEEARLHPWTPDTLATHLVSLHGIPAEEAAGLTALEKLHDPEHRGAAKQAPRRPGGHPRHQLRRFRVAASHGTDPGSLRLGVEAQTEHDAILRAGMELNRRYPESDPARWRVAAVTDPAPATWTPGDDQEVN